LELARAKLRSPERWGEIQRNLAAFGLDSGLFTDIDIRQFGKSDIDPFQVLVRLGKDRRNLVDVGYGISQVLPIIYPIQMSNIYNAFLLQQPEVHLHPRAQAELGNLIVSRIQRSNKQRRPTMFVVETHSDYIIDRLRILIMTQVLDPKDVTIVFFERHEHDCTTTNLFLDKNGEIVEVPEHFRDFFIQEHSRLLGL
jgi:predicted ATPase